jgi:hypothetical protein
VDVLACLFFVEVMLYFDRMEFFLIVLFRIKSELHRHTSHSELFSTALGANVTFNLLGIILL